MLLTLLACAPAALTFTPDTLDFGEVDFSGEMPDEGYASMTVTLAHEGGPSVQAWLPAYDFERLCLTGFPESFGYPADLGELSEGSSYVFQVGVCAYLPGEGDAPVSTELVVSADSDIVLPITFTPVRGEE
jgi:hypothetical protein